MKSKLKAFYMLPLFLMIAYAGFGQTKDTSKDASMFPEAKEGYQKVVLYLPKKSKEENLKVEIIVGRNAEVDNCNNHFLAGEFKEKDLKGWGYTYYEYKSKGNIASTLMACPDDKKVTKFVSGQGEIIRYNSKLPVVVYIPAGMELKYRIWKAKPSYNSVKP